MSGTFGSYTFSNVKAEIEIHAGETVTIPGLPIGRYSITEDETKTSIEHYHFTSKTITENGSVTVNTRETVEVEVVNTYEPNTGSLEVKKVVTESADATKAYHFTVTLSDKTINGLHGSMQFEDGIAGFDLKVGEIAKATGLPAGTEYTVDESSYADDGYDDPVYRYSHRVTEGGEEVDDVRERAIVSDETNIVTVTNNREFGDLVISKKVVFNGGTDVSEIRKTYYFEVTGPNEYCTVVSVPVGTGTSGEQRISRLVPGTYTVREIMNDEQTESGALYTGAEMDGWTLDVTGNTTAEVTAGVTVTAEITNTYTSKLGKLEIIKVTEDDYDEVDSKTYYVRVKGSDGKYVVNPADNTNVFTVVPNASTVISGLEPGNYTVEEINAEVDGYTLTATGMDVVEVVANNTASVKIKNKYELKVGSLKIHKTVNVVNGEIPESTEFNFTISTENQKVRGKTYGNVAFNESGVAALTLASNQEIVIEKLPIGKYTISENAATVEGYDLTVTYNGLEQTGVFTVDVEEDSVVGVSVTNNYTRQLGSMIIRKEVEIVDSPAAGPAEIDAFGFTDGMMPMAMPDEIPALTETAALTESELPASEITEPEAAVTEITDPAVSGILGSTTPNPYYRVPVEEIRVRAFIIKVTDPEGKPVINSETGSDEFVIRDGGYVRIDNLIPGEYTVTEVESPAEGWEWKVTINGTEGIGRVTVEANKESAAEVLVKNTYSQYNPEVGSLTVYKEVTGYSGDASGKSFTFDVYGPLEFAYDLDETPNPRTHTLGVSGNNSATLEGLEPGTYTITERDANIKGYTLNVTGDTEVSVPEGGNVTANITNDYTERDKGSLTIVKTITGLDPEDESKATYTFKIVGVDETAKEIFNEARTISAATGWTVIVSDLKPGTYTVTERSGEIEGYTLEVTGEGDYPVGTEEVEVAINNNYTEIPKGSLTVTKTVTGDTEAAEGKVFIFDIAGPDGYTNTVTVAAGESATVTDLEPGTYTVTERNGEIEGYTLEVTGEGDYTVGAEEISIEIVNNYTEILKGSLVINKEVVGGGEEAANKTYTFDVTGPEGYSTTVTVTGNGSAVLTDLTLGEYTITERNAEIEGYTLEVTGSGTVTVEGNENAEITITNTYAETPKGSLVISKEVVGGGSEASEKTYTFEVTGPNGYSAEVTVIGNGSATLNNLEPGIYTVSEKDAAIEGYTLEVTGEGETEVVANENAAVTVTNTYEQIVGSLTVTKSVVGGGDEAANKIYTFVITGPNDYSNTVTVIGSGSVTVEGLVPGEYTVTEQNAEIEGYRLTVDGTETATVVADENVDVTITNSYDLIVGSLTVTKSVVGGPEDAANREYTFLVTGPDGYAATVTVTGNGSATLEGLVPGEYTVTEQNAEIEGYSLTVGGEGTVTVIADQNIDTTITNNYELLLGSLTLTKAIAGGGEGAANRIYTFVVTGPEGYSNTVNIIGSGSVTLTDLIPGEYIVTEQNAEISGYRWNVSGEGAVTVVGGEGVQLTVTNTYDELRDINVYKEWYVNGSRTSAPYGAQITVVLLADGEATGDQLTLSEANNWSGAFTGLLVNAEDGHEIVYTVAEVYYAGWTSSVSGSADAGFVITNYTTTPEIPNIPNVPDNPYTPPTTPENPDVPYFPNNTFDIPDFDTPLSDIPDAETPLTDIPDAETPLTDIPDLDVPLDALPATGDESRTYLWVAVMLFSGLGIIVLIAMLIAEGRKSKENSESAE